MKMGTLTTIDRLVISTSSAIDVVTTALEGAAKAGVAASVWVVGPALEPIAFASMATATPHSRVTSKKKAQTAASTRRPTGWMPATLAIELPLASDGLLTNVAGGLPIKVNGAVIGGLGVAGGTVEQDAEIAIAALRHIGADIT